MWIQKILFGGRWIIKNMKKLLLSGEMDVNCYFIENQGKCYIIDPGYEKEKVIKYVKDNNWEVMGFF